MFIMQYARKHQSRRYRLTWRSRDTLVIGADDARHIVKTHIEDGLRCFICGDAADESQYSVEHVPARASSFFPSQ